MRAPNANWPSFHAGDRARDRAGRDRRRAGRRRRRPRPPRASRCCAGSPSRSCSRGIAKLDYALFPPLGAENVHLGDVLRVAAWGVLLRRRARRDAQPHAPARTRPPIDGERRRLARELHDGVAQELAFIRRRAGRLAELPDGVEIVDAADRALEDSRRAIEALVPPAHEPLEVALERLGARLATECGLEVQVNVRVAADITDDVRAELVPDHLRGGPQRRQPRRRAPRARRPGGLAAGRARDRRRLRLPRRRQQRPRRRRATA